MRERWTRRQDALLRKLWPYAQMRDLVQIIGRSQSALKNRANQLRLHRYTRKPYSARENRMLRKLFPHMSTLKVAKRLHRSVSSVSQHAYNKLGLKKTAKYLASPDACRLRHGDNVGAAFRFPPGHVPANKGLRRPGWAPGRMRETQFKKGQRPHTWLPVGTVVMADGYLRRKIADLPNNGNGANSNWEYVHKRVWEDAHGPVPKGHRIWWKDGNHQNCTLENLELLSDKEHIARTTVHRLPRELRDTIMLAGRLKRVIREKTREAGEEVSHAEQHHRAAQAPV